MTQIVVAQRMWQRRDTAANWTSVNPVLQAGEIGVELGATTAAPQKFKIGNGVSPWTDLAYGGGGEGTGSVWRHGTGVPSDGVGNDGDYYLRTTNGDVYARAGGTYSVVGNIMGAPGEDGSEVEMRVSGGYIQWRYVGAPSWTNLLDLSTLEGDPGPPGDPGPAGPPGPSSSCFPTASFDGGTGAIQVGSWCEIFVPFGFDITRWTLLAQPLGNIVIDVRAAPLIEYPPAPGDSLCGVNAPRVVGDSRAQDAILDDWTTSVPSGSVIRFQVVACVGVIRATLTLEGARS